jgi:hypothetical protein
MCQRTTTNFECKKCTVFTDLEHVANFSFLKQLIPDILIEIVEIYKIAADSETVIEKFVGLCSGVLEW